MFAWDEQGKIGEDTVTFTLGETPGGTKLKAYAGPDVTVPGPSPALVWVDGCTSSGRIVSYEWFDQWGDLRADQGDCSAGIHVDFGKKPKVGTKRAFTLEIADGQGKTDQDKVTITLGKSAKR